MWLWKHIYIYIYRRSTGSTRTHMHMYIIMGIHLDYLIWLYVQLYFHIVMLLKMATAYSLHIDMWWPRLGVHTRRPCCSAAGLPLSLLQADWWVPGSTARAECAKFAGKPLFREILTTTQESCLTWIKRATQDHVFTTHISLVMVLGWLPKLNHCH